MRFSSYMDFTKSDLVQDLETSIENIPNKNLFTKPMKKGINAKSTEVADTTDEIDDFDFGLYKKQMKKIR